MKWSKLLAKALPAVFWVMEQMLTHDVLHKAKELSLREVLWRAVHVLLVVWVFDAAFRANAQALQARGACVLTLTIS